MERYEDSFLQAGLTTVDQLAQISTQSVSASATFSSVCTNCDLDVFIFCFFFFSQGFAPHGSDSGRTPEEDPFQHPEHDLSEQEHHHCDLLKHLPVHADMNSSRSARVRARAL